MTEKTTPCCVRGDVRQAARPMHLFRRILTCAALGFSVPGVWAADEPDSLNCGAHCLYVAAMVFDCQPEGGLAGVEKILGPPSANGYTFERLSSAARSLGLETRCVATSVRHLKAREGRFACIAHLNGDHFVLVGDISDGTVNVIDSPHRVELPKATFLAQWNGAALLVSNSPLQAEEEVASRLWWNDVARRIILALAVGGVLGFAGRLGFRYFATR